MTRQIIGSMELSGIGNRLGGKIAEVVSAMDWSPEQIANETKKFAKERPITFICTASVGVFSIVPIGTFLIFMVFTLVTAFFGFAIVAAVIIGFGTFMLAFALIVMACLALPPGIFLASFYLGSSACLKLASSVLNFFQKGHMGQPKNEGAIPLIPGQGGSNVIELPDYMKKGEGDSQPIYRPQQTG